MSQAINREFVFARRRLGPRHGAFEPLLAGEVHEAWLATFTRAAGILRTG